MKSVKLLAPAKVNLALDITGAAPDGYHMLETVMLAVDLCDQLVITRQPEGDGQDGFVGCGMVLDAAPGVDITGLSAGPDNLISRAVDAFFAHTGFPPRGLMVHLLKRIPMQAGLAGGSADAAAALVGLDALFGAGLSGAELETIALTLGADVPFCVRGGCALARGVGERFEPLPPPAGSWLLLAKPPEGMDTGAAFARYDRLCEAGGEMSRPDLPALCAALRAGDLPGAGAGMVNVFEAVCELESVRRLKAVMLDAGALGAAMTGSGSAVVGLFDSRAAAARCAAALGGGETWRAVVQPSERGAAVVQSTGQ